MLLIGILQIAFPHMFMDEDELLFLHEESMKAHNMRMRDLVELRIERLLKLFSFLVIWREMDFLHYECFFVVSLLHHYCLLAKTIHCFEVL